LAKFVRDYLRSAWMQLTALILETYAGAFGKRQLWNFKIKRKTFLLYWKCIRQIRGIWKES